MSEPPLPPSASSSPSTLSPQLRCIIQTIPDEINDDDSNRNDGTENPPTATTTLMWQFQQEEGKKSSFVLDFSDNEDLPLIAWDKPAHIVIECVLDNNDKELSPIPFLLGGLELVSNSRNMEVYLTKSNAINEDYLMTCRGIPSSQHGQPTPQYQWHNTLSVIPGGPRSVVKVHLKLLGLRPDTTTHAVLKLIKVKGRLPLIEDIVKPVTTTSATAMMMTATQQLPQVATVASQPAVSSPSEAQSNTIMPPPPISTDQLSQQPQPTAHPQQPHAAPQTPTSPFAAQPDLGMAFLAGISNMLRATEDRMLQTIQHHVTRQVQHDCQQLSHQISHHHKDLLDKQHKILRQQQRVLENQGRILQQLESRQAQLIDDVSQLQGQLQQVLQRLPPLSDPPQQQLPQQQQPQPRVNAIPYDHQEEEQVEDEEEDGSSPEENRRAVEELLADEPPPSNVKDDDDVEPGSTTVRSDLSILVPDDDAVMEDLLEILHEDTAAKPPLPTKEAMRMGNDDHQLWLPEPNDLEPLGDAASSPHEKDDAIVDLLQWLTSTPTNAERSELLRKQEYKSSENHNQNRPLWIVGEGTDDMVVIHGLPPPNQSTESPTIPNDDDYDVLSNEHEVLSPQQDQQEEQEELPDSPSKHYHATSVDRPTLDQYDDNDDDDDAVNTRRLVVPAISSWKGTKSEEDDDPDHAKYLERPSSSY